MAIAPSAITVVSPLWQGAVGSWDPRPWWARPVPLALGLVAVTHAAGAWWVSQLPSDAPEVREPPVLTVSLLATPRAEPVLPPPAAQRPVVRPHPVAAPRPPAAPITTAPRASKSPGVPLTAAVPSAAPMAVAPMAAATPLVPTAAPPAAVSVAAPAVNPEPSRTAQVPKVLTASAVRYLVEPVLTYPRASRELGESGTVVLKVLVDEQGRPKEIEVAKSSGHSRLDQQALQAMRRARFQPHIEDGAARPVWVMAPQTFTLEDQ